MPAGLEKNGATIKVMAKRDLGERVAAAAQQARERVWAQIEEVLEQWSPEITEYTTG
jgi:hypothetical protein